MVAQEASGWTQAGGPGDNVSQAWVSAPCGVAPHIVGGGAPPHMISFGHWASSCHITALISGVQHDI